MACRVSALPVMCLYAAVTANWQLFYSPTDCEALCGRMTRYCVFSLTILFMWYLEIPTSVLLEGRENHIIAKAVAPDESFTHPFLM